MDVRLLIVDDNAIDRERILRLLGADYAQHILEASTAREALRLSESSTLDCVLLDYRLPDADGTEVLDRFVERGLPVVMLTGQGDERVAVEAMKLGAHDYLVKGGLDGAALRRAVGNGVETHRLRQQIESQQDELRARVDELARQRRELEESNRALREREAKLQVVLRQLPAIVWTTDTELRMTSVTGSARSMIIDEADAVGMSIGAIVPEADHEHLEEAHARALAGTSAAFELTWRGRWFQGHAEPLRDEQGGVFGVIAASLDTTETHQLEQQLRHSQKMEALGKLAGGVAHDFNNLLTVIISFAGFAKEALREKDPTHEDLDQVLHASERGARLVKQLMAFSRHRKAQSRIVDVNDIVTGLIPMARRLLGEDIELDFTPGEDRWNARVDPGGIEQILMNLAVNARDALAEGGRLSISTRNISLETGLATNRGSELAQGDYIVLSVADDGPGIPAEILDKVFEPFFTTKDVASGTGLGLATCYGIARQAGGDITVYSEPGGGTTFRVYLPRAREGASELREPAEPLPVQGGTEGVLVVEDEPQVRAVVVRTLRSLGYQVYQAASVPAAEQLVAAQGDAIALMIADIVMPGPSGPEFGAMLARSRPGIRTLYMTGYASDSARQRGFLDDASVALEKPFTPDALARKVRELLDR